VLLTGTGHFCFAIFLPVNRLARHSPIFLAAAPGFEAASYFLGLKNSDKLGRRFVAGSSLSMLTLLNNIFKIILFYVKRIEIDP